MHQHQGHSKNLHLEFETAITDAYMDNKAPNLVCEFPKPLAVIGMNQVHELLRC